MVLNKYILSNQVIKNYNVAQISKNYRCRYLIVIRIPSKMQRPKTHVSIKSAIFYLIFVVNSLGFEKSRFKTFLKVQEAGTSSKLSDLLAWKGAQMNKLVQKLKQTIIVVLERLLASQVLKVHFFCLPTPFDIILRGHTKNYLFEAN